MTGIYKIENKLNGKIYIGQAQNIDLRWQQHKFALKNSNNSWYIEARQESNNVDDFDFSVLQECTPAELDELEQYWINYYNSYNKGYNKTKGGQNIHKDTNSGIKLIIQYDNYKHNLSQTLLTVLTAMSQIKITYTEKILIILFLSQIDNIEEFYFTEGWINQHTGITHDTYINARKHLSELEIIKCENKKSLTLSIDNLLNLTNYKIHDIIKEKGSDKNV